MGDHGGWAQPGRPQPNGLIPGEESTVSQVLDVERWTAAEERTTTLIRCIQPSRPSEARRNAVADYVRRLIMNCISCEVFTFGSVPLKTYLPDGDIDLSAFSRNPHLKDSWANEVRQALEKEEKNENAEFHVKEVQYIQAEVKLIKCLVENIVVDISFNQLGGLCTLCFLEEVDNLINRDYLYKRSIILIKAWCYYESRILGAHHGLISTYALETLVLYIFNVFNNSFAGPLEVLYRFLEFFSNFDWENFCVSLRGPVPISSLPDTTAEPPRKDGEKLLLDELFLNSCHTVYAVHPFFQENQGQPFVSKHFNVIDPLRTNNNLGRSVSKGNFYRIRSAFAFGAKRLAALLECPKDGLIAEVDKFFMNTWRRHGSGHRPDAPTLDMQHLQPFNTSAIDDVEILGNSSEVREQIETVRLPAGLEYHVDGLGSFNSIPQLANASAERAQNVWTNSPSSYSESQKSYDSQAQYRALNTMGRNINSSKTVPSDEYPKNPGPDSFAKRYEGPGRFQFSRTQSSPELTDSFTEISSRGRGNRLGELKTHFTSGRPDQSSKMKNYGAGFSGVYTARSISNSAIVGHSLSQQSLSGVADSNSVSNSYHDDSGYENLGDDVASVSESLEMQHTMQQEEQDLINMMASSRINSPQPAIHISPHFPAPLSPVLASMGYSHRHTRAMPSNSFSELPWGSNIQFPHGLISSPISNYFCNSGLGSSTEEIPDSSNGDSTDQEDSDHWLDRDTGSSQGLFSEKTNVMPYFEGKQLPTLGGFSFVSSSQVGDSGVSLRSQHKFVRENNVPARKEHTDVNSRENDIYSLESSGDLRFTPTLQTSRNRTTISESWEGSYTKVSKSPRDKRGRKPYSLHGKAKDGLDHPPSDNISVPTDDDSREWVTTSLGTDAEQTMGSSPLSASHVQGIQIPGYEPALMGGSNQVIPFGPIIVCAGPAGSRQRTLDNSGVGPMAFYPTGPPVPFLTMLPMYNYPSDSGNPDGPSDQFNAVDTNTAKSSDQNYSFCERSEQPEALTASNPVQEISSEQFEHHESNILSSDFARHWQNLQFARLCQNTHSQGPVYYPSPVAVPQMYLQGTYVPNSSGPGRPPSANIGTYSHIMNYGPRLVPIAPLQPSSSRPTGAYQRHGEEAPRYRGGTGTYLPNPKVAFRDRQPSTTRSHRAYNHNHNEHGDRDGSWVSSKSRGSRNHGRLHLERPSSRGDSYRHERVASHLTRNSSFSSASSDNVPTDMPYGMYSLPSASANGVRPTAPALPSVVMLYSYDPVAGYGSSTEHVEFGSMHPPLANEEPYPNEGSSTRSLYEQRHAPYQRSSPNSSPDRPSSPQIRR